MVRVAVPGGIGDRVAQPEVGRHVDDLNPVRQGRDDRLRRAMGQAAEHDVNVVPVDLADGDHGRQAEPAKVRKHALDRIAGMAFGGEHADIDTGVPQQQAEEFGARVPAGTQHRDPFDIAHDRISPVRFRPHPQAAAREKLIRDRKRYAQAVEQYWF